MTTNTTETDAMRERDRIVNIILQESRYWKDIDDPLILDFASGAVGACGNILARVLCLNILEKKR